MSERVRGVALQTLNLTATDNSSIVSNNTGQRKFLRGIFVSSASSVPTLAVSDSLKTIAAQFTPAVGWYDLPVIIDGTLTVAIGGTVNCTVYYGSE